jgi:hypothetical protein
MGAIYAQRLYTIVHARTEAVRVMVPLNPAA